MNKLLLLLLSIYCVFCSMDDCTYSTDQDLCNSIKVEDNSLYCFKADLYDPLREEVVSQCLVYPKTAEYQKLYWQLENGLNKELYSIDGKNYVTEEIEAQLIKPKKEFYNTNEVIKTGPGSLSSKDEEIFKSENTCAFNLFDKFMRNPNEKINNITDKNTCFNARQFEDLENLIDCGYAIIKFKVNGENHEFKTCHLVPTSKFPQSYSILYMSYIEEGAADDLLKDLLLHISKNDGSDERRRLATITYEIEAENKYGRKVKYSSQNTQNFEILAEGVEGNHSSYIGINLILLFLLFAF